MEFNGQDVSEAQARNWARSSSDEKLMLGLDAFTEDKLADEEWMLDKLANLDQPELMAIWQQCLFENMQNGYPLSDTQKDYLAMCAQADFEKLCGVRIG
jgi:hypothetical protein